MRPGIRNSPSTLLLSGPKGLSKHARLRTEGQRRQAMPDSAPVNGFAIG